MRIIPFSITTDPSILYSEYYVKKGENLSSELQITLPEEYLGYNYRLAFQLNENTPVLTDEIVPVESIIHYVINNNVTTEVGKLHIEVQFLSSGTTYLEKSYRFVIRVADSIDETLSIPVAEAPNVILACITATEEAVASKLASDIATAEAVAATIAAIAATPVTMTNEEYLLITPDPNTTYILVG